MTHILSKTQGKVILAGAGPGDPDLITLKTLRYLQSADVILTDRLVSPELLNYAKPEAQILYVGKQCSKGIHTSQKTINQLLAGYASKGYLVLRLKGGDSGLFSNILDELQTLQDHGIPYEIIPGISAAFGASAFSAIPLTARGYAKGVRFLTLCDLNSIKQNQWQDWAQTDDTLVFYMSGQRISDLMSQLKDWKVSSHKKLAVIEQATTPYQKTQIFSWDQHDQLPIFSHVPTLIIVGAVVALHEQFRWKDENHEAVSYFDQHQIKEVYAAAN